MKAWMPAVAALGLLLAGCQNGDGLFFSDPPAPAPSVEPETIIESLGGGYAPCVQRVANGSSINWSTGEIIASGKGLAKSGAAEPRLMAARAAELDAGRNALLIAAGVRLGAPGHYADLREGTVNVEGTIRDQRVVAEDWDAKTNTATVLMAVPMYGAHGTVQINKTGLQDPSRVWPWPPSADANWESDLIIIDARGTKMPPCPLPRLATEDGLAVFDASFLSKQELASHAVAVLAVGGPGAESKPLEAAGRARVAAPGAASSGSTATMPAAGLPNHLYLKAARWESPATIILDPSELAKLGCVGNSMALLKAGRLVIIVERPAATTTQK